ncbi:MAG: MauE/DoxX family redox-associated membrane protein [Phycisphaerae bacterium]
MSNTVATQPQTSWSVFGWLARIAVAGLFLVAASGKLIKPETFAKEIREYRMIPDEWSNALALTVPWVEGICAVLLLSGLWRREARLLIVVMLAVFTAVKIIIVAQGRKIDCGCFGDLSALNAVLNGPTGILLNVVLLVLCWVCWRGERAAAGPLRAFPAQPDRDDRPTQAASTSAPAHGR